MKNKLNIKHIAWIPALIGMGWAVWQWLYERGLWLDEASLGLNLLDRNLRELSQPLDYGQAAPVFYLLITKMSAVIFGQGVLSMRLPSLLCYLISAIIFLKILFDIINTTAARILGISLFCFNFSLLRYSGELKQYMMEVMVCIVLTYLILHLIKRDGQRPWALLFFGMISIPLSHTAITVLAMVGLIMIYTCLKTRSKRLLQTTIICGLIWLITQLTYYLIFIKNHPLQPYMIQYWTRIGGFGPVNPLSSKSLYFLTNKLSLLLKAKYIFNFSNKIANWSLVLIPLAFWLWGTERKNRHLLFLCIPLIFHFILSFLHIYPFEIRLILYLLPLTILAITIGLDKIFNLLPVSPVWTSWIMLFICIWQAWIFQKQYLPIRSEELKSVASAVSQRIKSKEMVWLNPDAGYAFKYYTKIGDIHFPENITVEGEPIKQGGLNYEQQIIKLESDAWLLLTHINKQETTRLLQALKVSGYVVTDSVFAPNAYGYLVRTRIK